MQAKGLTAKATTAFLSGRTPDAVHEVREQIRCERETELYERFDLKARVPWSTAEKQRVYELCQQGATRAELCRAFPHRRYSAVLHAIAHYSKNPTAAEGKARYQRWTDKESRYLREAAAQGVSTLSISQKLGRSVISINSKAKELKVHLCGTDYFTPEDDKVLTQMRMDGCRYKQVAAVLNCTVHRVKKRWRILRPVAQSDLRPHNGGGPPGLLGEDDRRIVKRLLDEGKSWSAVYRMKPCGYSTSRTLAIGYKRAMKKAIYYSTTRPLQVEGLYVVQQA